MPQVRQRVGRGAREEEAVAVWRTRTADCGSGWRALRHPFRTAMVLLVPRSSFTSSAAGSPAARPPGSSPSAGIDVVLHEMRPVRATPAHKTDRLAELVCSNTFKSTETSNAHGLLKAEMRVLGSMILAGGRRSARARRAARSPSIATCSRPRCTSASRRIRASSVVREEVTTLPSPGIVATGPLTSDALADGDPRATRRRVARVLRRDRADRLGRVDRRRRRLPRVALRARRWQERRARARTSTAR